MDESLALMELWLRTLKARNCSKNTLDGYRWAASKFLHWCTESSLALADVKHGHVADWLDSRHIGPRSRYAYTSILATFFGWLEREEHLPSNPVTRVDRPRLGRYLPRPAATATIHGGLDTAEPRVVAMIALGAFAGMRRFEIAGLRSEDLLLHRDPPVVLVHGKGNKERLVPLHGALLSALRVHGIPTTGWVFPSPHGGPLTPGYVGRLITRALAELEHVTPHQLRHWFGTETYRASLDLRLVGDLMGHANPATTAIYTAFSQPRAAEIVTGLPSRPVLPMEAEPDEAA